MSPREFADACRANGIVLDDAQLRCFVRYAELLAEWNERVNLISRRDVANIWEKHLLHSVAILVHATIPEGARIADIGTGGGLPGIPLKICRPDLSVTLIDSIQKKVRAIESIATALQQCDERMAGIRVVCNRAEALAADPSFAKSFDVVTARAVAPLGELLRWALPLLASRGILIALKGGSLDEEIAALKQSDPKAAVVEMPLSMIGVPSFEQEEKKLVIVSGPAAQRS